MKSLRILPLITLLTVLSCGDKSPQNTQDDFSEYDYASESYQAYGQDNSTPVNTNGGYKPEEGRRGSNNNSNSSSSNKKNHKIMSQQYNMVYGILPIPTNWEARTNDKDYIVFSSPQGVKVYQDRFASFHYSNNPQINQMSAQSGMQVQPVASIETVIQRDLAPVLKKSGHRILRQYEYQNLAALYKRQDSYLFKGIPENKQYRCVILETEDGKGNKSVGVFRYFITQYQGIDNVNWGYTLNQMDAPAGIFEQAKANYLFALSNLKINPNWIKTNNNHYASKSKQSTMAHNRRMAEKRAYNQTRNAIAASNSSILDDNFNSYMKRSKMNDAGHSKSVDAVWERSNWNDQSGNTYQVDGYYDQVYKGTNDVYAGSNNPNWNPNVDSSTNDVNWEELEENDQYYNEY